MRVAAFKYRRTCSGPLYGILFEVAAGTLRTIVRDPKHLGGEIGFTVVLHTWDADPSSARGSLLQLCTNRAPASSSTQTGRFRTRWRNPCRIGPSSGWFGVMSVV